MNTFETIYRKLDKLGVIAAINSGTDYQKSKLKTDAFMDLNMDVLERTDDYTVIALAHYYEQNGDLCADPDMQVRIYTQNHVAEALTFQMANPPIYQEVYPEPGKIAPKLKRELNSFLNQWLRNCINQGHKFN